MNQSSLNPAVSVVLPCLNEQEAVGPCIKKIQQVFNRHNIAGEIIVCDNGSSDHSVAIAESSGARVVHEPNRGYGRAYLTGFSHTKGQYLIMGDADGTYDFNEIPNFLKKLIDEKNDFVTGSRYLNGGIKSMPFLHRYLGNPFLTFILNFLYGVNFSDVYSGFRAFTHEAYDKIQPVSPGMEFNLELAINAKLAGLKITEIPITLHERVGQSKLKTFEDGWRSLRMMLLYCPNKLFIAPGIFLFLLGVSVHLLTLIGIVKYQGRALSNVTGIFGIIFSVLGFELLLFGLQAKTYSWSRRFNNNSSMVTFFDKIFTLERGLMTGMILMLSGLFVLISLISRWLHSDLMPLPHPEWVSFASTLVIIGSQTIFSSFFISTMSIKEAAKM